MKCPFCLHEMHPVAKTTRLDTAVNPTIEVGNDKGDEYQVMATVLVCPGCRGASVNFDRYNFSGFKFDSFRVFPQTGAFSPAPPEVPSKIAEDFNEASLVLQFSSKAAAALCRRCLQAILSAHGYTSKNLVEQIEAALKEADTKKSLPSSIRENMDAIRNFGNFSAHPITDKTSLQIVEVEQGETEWCLEILLDLFDYYYVSPAKSAVRRASLSQKLAGAGKPPMKQ